jgi:hypothetical protein
MVSDEVSDLFDRWLQEVQGFLGKNESQPGRPDWLFECEGSDGM